MKKNSLLGKIREFLNFAENQGKIMEFKKILFLLGQNIQTFIAIQMWLLVVSFCHMHKIPADLPVILFKGGVLVRWSTVCCNYSVFSLL